MIYFIFQLFNILLYFQKKGKGVEKLIEISNPNRVQMKSKKLSTLNDTLASSSKPDLSRKEREELERQAAQARYQKLHAEGRTEEARADLARLAIIKAQREEAAKKRELEKLRMWLRLRIFSIFSSIFFNIINNYLYYRKRSRAEAEARS